MGLIDVMTEERHAVYQAWKAADQISRTAAIWADRGVDSDIAESAKKVGAAGVNRPLRAF